jgi:mRNA-degrading endonuclease RelE of RelBE toxin-antitoxin system
MSALTAGYFSFFLASDIRLSFVRSRLDMLRNEPFAGKRLERELSGYRSLRSRRFRITYKVDRQEPVLQIHHVGHRKDIYELLAE